MLDRALPRAGRRPLCSPTGATEDGHLASSKLPLHQKRIYFCKVIQGWKQMLLHSKFGVRFCATARPSFSEASVFIYIFAIESYRLCNTQQLHNMPKHRPIQNVHFDALVNLRSSNKKTYQLCLPYNYLNLSAQMTKLKLE